jgi:hypothetical protein
MHGMNEKSDKMAFIVMFEEGSYLKDRVSKICQSFNENSFEFRISEAKDEFLQISKAKNDV